MRVTQDFRGQHDAAMTLVDDIRLSSELLCRSADSERAGIVAAQLGQLTDLLQLHFALEDRLLYPALMAAPDDLVSATARRFFDEMGDIGPAYTRFAAAWTSPAAIERAPIRFHTQSEAIFTALATRIAHEDAELYPLAEWFFDARPGGAFGQSPDDRGPSFEAVG